MKPSRTLQIILIALAATSSIYGADDGLRVSHPAWKGLAIRFVTKSEPPKEGDGQLHGGVLSDRDHDGVWHHFIDDPVHKIKFGYDLTLTPAADGASADIHIQPLHTSDVSAEPGWKLLGPVKYPVIPNVKLGDTVVLDLLVNSASGEKIVDYLTLERWNGPPATQAHDFTLSDVKLYLDRPRVWINGKLAQATAQEKGGTAGNEVWFYLTGYGRYTFSLFPTVKHGSYKGGTVTGKAITFQDGSTAFRLQCESRIAPGNGVYKLSRRHNTSEPLSGF
jgi:hypothetical protein